MNVRRTDPETSREAVRGREKRISDHCHLVLKLVAEFPEKTAVELAELAPERDELDRDVAYWRPEVSRRLGDLKNKHKLVRVADVRACSINGTKMSTWVVRDSRKTEEHV